MARSAFPLVPASFRFIRLIALVTAALAGLGLRPQLAAQTTPAIVWGTPAPVPFPTPLSSVQLDAQVLTALPVPVPLTSVFNITGIVTPGTPFTGGFDGGGTAYSATQLGSSVVWQGITFQIGAPNVPNAVSSASIPLPAGQFASLLMLGDLVNNQVPPTGTFVVTYTDGTTSSLTQSMSDWVHPLNYAGESMVDCGADRYSSNGTVNPNSVCVYGYQIVLNSAKTVKTLTLPNDRDIVMLSMVLVPAAVPGSLTYSPGVGAITPEGVNPLTASFVPANPSAYGNAAATVSLTVTKPSPLDTPEIIWPTPASIMYGTPLSSTQLTASAAQPYGPALVNLAPVYRVNAIYSDQAAYASAGFDGTDSAYSYAQLGQGSLAYHGGVYPLGPANVPNGVTSTTAVLPVGNFSTLYLLGAAASASAQTNQTFTVTYTDGTTTKQQLSLSSWTNPQNFTGETIVAATTYKDTSAGLTVSGVFDVYGYQVTLDPTRTVSTLTLPSNSSVVILAAGLGEPGTFNVPGTFVFTPGAGTVLPAGQNPLSVAFTPNDTGDFTAATGTNSILVAAAPLIVESNSATRVYGAPNPSFSGVISGLLAGDRFTESFSTAATAASPPGVYGIVPTAAGSHLGDYTETIEEGTLTVSKAPATVTVGASPGSIFFGDPVVLTSTVATTTIGVPTGTVTFYSNSVLLGAATLNSNGTAAFTTTQLAPGTDAVTACYSGDVDFLASAAPCVGISVPVSDTDFTLQALNGTTFTGSLGQDPQLTMRLAPTLVNYPGTVNFSVTGELPPFATASFSPAWVGIGAGPVNVTLQVTTIKLSEAGRVPEGLFWAVLLLLPATGGLRRFRRRVAPLALIAAGILAMTVMSGCGSGYHSASYPLTVTAVGGDRQHTLQVTLQIVPPGN